MKFDQHLDYDALAALKEIMDEDFLLLIDTFFQDSTTRILTLRTFMNSTDGDAIRRAAHSFKGSCSNLGALHLANLCSALEHKGLLEKFDALDVDINAIEEEFLLVKKMLIEYCQ